MESSSFVLLYLPSFTCFTVCLPTLYTHTHTTTPSLIIHHHFVPHSSSQYAPSHPVPSHLLSNPNDPARRTPARVARSLALLVPAFAQVVGAAVHDDGAAEDAFGPDELDLLVRDGPLGVALGVRLEVAQVADVAFGVGGGAVRFGEGVDWGPPRFVCQRLGMDGWMDGFTRRFMKGEKGMMGGGGLNNDSQ